MRETIMEEFKKIGKGSEISEGWKKGVVVPVHTKKNKDEVKTTEE